MPDHGPTPCDLPRRATRRTGTVVACPRCGQLYRAGWACAADSCVRVWEAFYPALKPDPERPQPKLPSPDLPPARRWWWSR